MHARSSEADRSRPVIVLVKPQLGGNIGAAARAMANFGLPEMRLVAPCCDWPNSEAQARASGATSVLDRATLHDSVSEAVADRQLVLATTARVRALPRPSLTPRQSAERIARAGGMRSAILFGGERAGLENDELEVAEGVIRIPTDPGFTSLNLAQAVLLVGYELWMASRGGQTAAEGLGQAAAERRHLTHLADTLVSELDDAGYFRPAERRASTVAQLRTLIFRQQLTEPEVRMLYGLIRALRRSAVP